LRIRAVLGISFIGVTACASHDESLGCAELVVSCPAGAEQQWWLAKKATSTTDLRRQDGDCGSWLAFIEPNATATYDGIDLGLREGEMRLRVMVAADDASTKGGMLTLTADDLTTPVLTCGVGGTGGWFNWIVVDCGPLSLRGLHKLMFRFTGTDPKDPYVFNFAAFGVVRAGSADCTVTGPKLNN
jgi:hypothetical protein